MKESDIGWRSVRIEKLKLENQIEVSDSYLRLLEHLDTVEPEIVIWQTSVDLAKPSFEEQLNSIILGTALKIQRRRRSFFGRLLFFILNFLLSFIPGRSSNKNEKLYELDQDRADLLDLIRSVVSETRESFIKVYKSLSKATRGGRLIDIRKSTRRFKFLRIYSNNIDEESLIANRSMKIYY